MFLHLVELFLEGLEGVHVNGRSSFGVVVFFDGLIFGLWKVLSVCVPRRGLGRRLVSDDTDSVLGRFPSGGHCNDLDRRKLERDALLCFAIEGRQSGRFGGRGQNKLAKGDCITTNKCLFVSENSSHKNSVKLNHNSFPRRELPSAIVTSAERKRTERFSEKSLNLENSLKSEVRFPSSKETLQLRR
jgi:hypothetical protein